MVPFVPLVLSLRTGPVALAALPPLLAVAIKSKADKRPGETVSTRKRLRPIFHRAGVKNLIEYVSRAAQLGLVVISGDGVGRWVALPGGHGLEADHTDMVRKCCVRLSAFSN